MPQEIPKDPWGHDWLYKFPATTAMSRILSAMAPMPAGGDGINADIVSWKSQ